MKNKTRNFLYLLLLMFPVVVNAQTPFALVELFTSEGCSSCPPADDILANIKKEAEKNKQNIITLAYHVDYWNKLGWKDPYSKLQFTTRQENYSRVIPGKEVFTPQAIVNGEFSVVGSDKNKIKEYIENALGTRNPFDLKISVDSVKNDSIYGNYKFSFHSVDWSMRLVLTEDGLTSNVTKGENSGKLLHHDSVVRYLFSIDSPDTTGNFKLPKKVFAGSGKKHLVAFVQRKAKMNVVAATEISIE